jgi:hypothetical protein
MVGMSRFVGLKFFCGDGQAFDPPGLQNENTPLNGVLSFEARMEDGYCRGRPTVTRFLITTRRGVSRSNQASPVLQGTVIIS